MNVASRPGDLTLGHRCAAVAVGAIALAGLVVLGTGDITSEPAAASAASGAPEADLVGCRTLETQLAVIGYDEALRLIAEEAVVAESTFNRRGDYWPEDYLRETIDTTKVQRALDALDESQAAVQTAAATPDLDVEIYEAMLAQGRATAAASSTAAEFYNVGEVGDTFRDAIVARGAVTEACAVVLEES